MKNVTVIQIDPYDVTLYFITSRKAYAKTRAKFLKGKINLKDCVGMSSHFNNGNVQLVGVFDGKPCTLAHEVAHMCFKVLEECGIPTDHLTSEAFCYLMSSVVSKCWRIMSKEL